MDISRWRCGSCGAATPNLLMLPQCGHTFCAACVDNWLWTYISEHGGQGRRYPCQACGLTYQIPVDGLDAFVQNVDVLQLESELQKLNMTPQIPDSNTLTNTIPSNMASNKCVSMAAHIVVDTSNHSGRTESEPCDGVMRTETSDPNIMWNVQAACSGEFASMETSRCALRPYTSYCQLPNHMF